MTLLIIKMIGAIYFCFTLNCMVPLPKAVSPPAIPFNAVFCMGAGWFKKSSRYGVTHHDTPESMIDCVNSCVEALVAINIAIFNSVLYLSCLLF
jgi:hypothetical protein